MGEVINQKEASNDALRSWVIYSSSGDLTSIQREVDLIFSGYSFYPELDWQTYNYPPPEGYKVMGAWRHPGKRIFAFLLDNPKIVAIKPSIQLLLYAIGNSRDVLNLETQISALKNRLASADIKAKENFKIGERLKAVNRKPLYIITAILGIFVAIINAYSLYQWKIGPFDFGNQELSNIYKYLWAPLHFIALILFTVAGLICAVFLIKFGYLLIKRL